jgi:DNA-binding NarL/FixJ family response regulator
MRILLAGMSNMLTSIITAALQQSPDMIIAGLASEQDDLADRVRAAQIDGVIMQVAEPGDFERFRPLLISFPSLKVVGIRSVGRGAFVHELHPRSTQLVELSAVTLLAALQATSVPSTH